MLDHSYGYNPFYTFSYMFHISTYVKQVPTVYKTAIDRKSCRKTNDRAQRKGKDRKKIMNEGRDVSERKISP